MVPAKETNKPWYSRYVVIPKKGGGLRCILDLRVLNKYLRTYRFKMLTHKQLLNTVSLGDRFATIDLTDAYFLVGIHPNHRQLLSSAFKGGGLRVHGPTIRTIPSYSHLFQIYGGSTNTSQGICSLAYLDD